MKKQTVLAGIITTAFILVAAGASFAGDWRGHRPGDNHWKGKHFAAQKHYRHWKRGHQVRHPQAQWRGRHQIPRHRLGNRDAHHRAGQYGHRFPLRHEANRYPAGASFRRQHDGRGESGQVSDRHAMRRGDRQAGRDRHAAYASDDTQARRGDRNASGRQRDSEHQQ